MCVKWRYHKVLVQSWCNCMHLPKSLRKKEIDRGNHEKMKGRRKTHILCMILHLISICCKSCEVMGKYLSFFQVPFPLLQMYSPPKRNWFRASFKQTLFLFLFCLFVCFYSLNTFFNAFGAPGKVFLAEFPYRSHLQGALCMPSIHLRLGKHSHLAHGNAGFCTQLPSFICSVVVNCVFNLFQVFGCIRELPIYVLFCLFVLFPNRFGNQKGAPQGYSLRVFRKVPPTRWTKLCMSSIHLRLQIP